jgi:hypothetical protein
MPSLFNNAASLSWCCSSARAAKRLGQGLSRRRIHGGETVTKELPMEQHLLEAISEAGVAKMRNVLPKFTRGRALIGECGAPYKCPPAPSESNCASNRSTRYAVRSQKNDPSPLPQTGGAPTLALEIKTRFPVLQVSVYDSVNKSRAAVDVSSQFPTRT